MTADYFDRVAWRGLRRAGRYAARAAAESFGNLFFFVHHGQWGSADASIGTAEAEADDAIDYYSAAAFLDWKRKQAEKRAIARNRRAIQRGMLARARGAGRELVR